MLRVTNLSKRFETDQKGRAVQNVRNVDFEISKGTFFTLLGPSGCGKTTTLRCVGGFGGWRRLNGNGWL